MIVGSVGVASASDVPSLMFWRFFQALGSAPGSSVGAGVIGDIYKLEERGKAIGIFVCVSDLVLLLSYSQASMVNLRILKTGLIGYSIAPRLEALSHIICHGEQYMLSLLFSPSLDLSRSLFFSPRQFTQEQRGSITTCSLARLPASGGL